MGPATLPTPLETTSTNFSSPGTTTFTSILPDHHPSTAAHRRSEPYRVFQRLNYVTPATMTGSFLTAILLLLALDRRDVSVRGEEPAVVEPIDPVERGQFDRFDRAPRSTTIDDLGLVETNDRLGEGCQRSFKFPPLRSSKIPPPPG